MEDLVPVIAQKKNIVVVQGIWPDEFENDNSIYEKLGKTQDKVYSQIPKTFFSANEWSNHVTNLKCWYCGLVPMSYPRFIPVNPRKDDKGADICDVEGNFHSWPCVISFIEAHKPKSEQADLCQLVCLFEGKFSGKIKNKIIKAPDKTKMKDYCGPEGITHEQYDALIEQSEKKYAE